MVGGSLEQLRFERRCEMVDDPCLQADDDQYYRRVLHSPPFLQTLAHQTNGPGTCIDCSPLPYIRP